MSYSDQQLREAVDAVFHKYDTDSSQSLDASEVLNLINDALGHMKSNRKVTQQEVNQFIAAVDKSGDGKIQKPELYEIFKKVLWLITSHIKLYSIHMIIYPRLIVPPSSIARRFFTQLPLSYYSQLVHYV